MKMMRLLLFVSILTVVGGILGALSVHAEEWQESEQEDLYLSEILDSNYYVKTELGGGYVGKYILYDVYQKKTIIEPNDGETRAIIRNDKRATVFYGKYRGKDEHKEYEDIYPELDISFFWDPIRKLGLKTSEIQEQDGQITVTEPEQIEGFLIPLSYTGVLDNEMFQITSIDLLFDEAGRPIEIRFHLISEAASPERVAYLETQLNQKYEYITRSVFDEAFSEISREMKEIKPFEEVEVVDYIDELSNVVKVVDEHFLLILQAQTKELRQRAGWDKKAVFAYLEAVDNKFGQFSRGYEGEQITQEEYLDQLQRVYQTAHLVGSDVYTYMFEASELSAKEKALLVPKQMGGYIDINGMLQLKDGDVFYPEMPPHSEFLEIYAEYVRNAYEGKRKTYKQLDNQMIHQFRMYIDRHNISYVRSHFEGRTDYEKLKQYAEEFEFSLYYGEPSRHHNKISGKEHFKEQKFDKILTPNRLSEFIIDVDTGNFVTIWDILKEDGDIIVSSAKAYREEEKKAAEKIVDTESFNYAPAEYAEAHQKLDVLPASPTKKTPELYLENKLKKAMKETWKSPDKKVYKEKYRKPKDYAK